MGRHLHVVVYRYACGRIDVGIVRRDGVRVLLVLMGFEFMFCAHGITWIPNRASLVFRLIQEFWAEFRQGSYST